jgi:hypothetical protein
MPMGFSLSICLYPLSIIHIQAMSFFETFSINSSPHHESYVLLIHHQIKPLPLLPVLLVVVVHFFSADLFFLSLLPEGQEESDALDAPLYRSRHRSGVAILAQSGAERLLQIV